VESLDATPGVIQGLSHFMNTADKEDEIKGLEFSAATVFEGRLIVSDDETKRVGVSLLTGADKAGQALFELVPQRGGFAIGRAFQQEFQQLRDANVRFDDIEGLTTQAGWLYLLGSQSWKRKTQARDPLREVMLRVRPGQPVEARALDLRAVFMELGSNSEELRAAAVAAGLTPQSIDQDFNAEALASVPNSGDLLIGLKAPRVGTDARCILLRIRNIDAFFRNPNSRPEVALETLLPLGGGGISSLEWDSSAGRYLVASNDLRPEALRSTLWSWTPGNDPIPLMHFRTSKLEGVTAIAEGHLAGHLLLVFDEETDSTPAKDYGSALLIKLP
jgi:hypothetical protein